MALTHRIINHDNHLNDSSGKGIQITNMIYIYQFRVSQYVCVCVCVWREYNYQLFIQTSVSGTCYTRDLSVCEKTDNDTEVKREYIIWEHHQGLRINKNKLYYDLVPVCV